MTRFDYAGDLAALTFILLIFLGGLLDYGYGAERWPRTLVWAATAPLGIWAAVGWARARWNRSSAAPARRMNILVIALVFWTLLLLIPLPSGLVAAISPHWKETLNAFQRSGIPVPDAVPLSIAPEAGWRSWNQFVASGFFLSGAMMLAMRGTGAAALAAIAAAFSVAEGIAGVVVYTTQDVLRAHGAIYNPSHHAVAVLMGLPLASTWLMEWRRRRLEKAGGFPGAVPGFFQDPAVLGWGLIFLAAVGWATAFSRGSLMLGLPIIVFWAAWEWRIEQGRSGIPLPRRRVAVLSTLGGLLLLVFLAAAVQGYFSRFTFKATELTIDRPEIWRASLEAFTYSPIFGLGPGGMEYAINRTAQLPTPVTPIEAHNEYLQLLAELGIIGIAGLIAGGLWIGRVWWKEWNAAARRFSRRQRRFRRAALAGLAVALLHATLDFHLRIPLVGFQALLLTALVFTSGINRAAQPVTPSSPPGQWPGR